MRRTTIFRSRRAAMAAALMVSAAAVQAQDTTRVLEAAQQPAVHVVATGETLWDLALRYLGDPFLWPEIYRINTLVVEDPHWIFPGEELRLVPAEEIAAEPGLVVVEGGVADTLEARRAELPAQEPEVVAPPVQAAPAPPPTETAPTIFLRDRTAGSRVASRNASLAYRYRPVRRGDFYSAGFLTEGESLPWAEVLGATGRPTLGNLTASSAAMIFGEVALRAPESAAYQIGDTLLVARLAREVRGWGHVVVPTGLVRVTGVAGANVRAQVVAQFGHVADGQVALPVQSFVDPGEVAPIPIENGAMGEVVALRDVAAFVGQQDVVFIDVGRADGVQLGDVFEVLGPAGESEAVTDAPGRPVSLLHVVHVREHSASGLVVSVRDLGTRPGALVRLVRKMPS